MFIKKTEKEEAIVITYELGIWRETKNRPPSYGLPAGPVIDACQ